MSEMPLRVVLVDDHEVVRNGIKSLLEQTPDVHVVGEAGTVKDAIARAEWAQQAAPLPNQGVFPFAAGGSTDAGELSRKLGRRAKSAWMSPTASH